MSLDYVKRGENVRASTINSLIDAVGGNETMSPDMEVVTTPRGPKFALPGKYGSPNTRPRELLETGRYILSGWPMTQIQLGPEMESALKAIRYHKGDGEVKNPVSAAVVVENTSDCPVGNQLSGYLLKDDDFGRDAGIGAAGWVKTMMEDSYGGKPPVRVELWAWNGRDKFAEVFTNTDEESVGSELSGLLQDEGEEVSSLVKIDGWTLSESKSLQVAPNKFVPTHETIKKTGTIDIYEGADATEYLAVLKADLYCYSKEQDGTTKWTWRIPLGSGATCSSGKAYCPSLTYGGNPVVMEVTENQITPAYSGAANYDNGDIYYGSFTVAQGETCSAGELWLGLAYDYTEKAVKGTFGNTQSQASYGSDGILSRNVLVASALPFTPAAEDEIGATSPRDSVTHGTWGVLPKDGPKLDSYCKEDSSTEFKSLEWADRDGDTVECQCAQLYRFDQLETSEPDEDDEVVIRHRDSSGGAEIKYIPLSSLDISGLGTPPDADVPEAEMSSIQTYELSDENKTVLELFKFHDSETVDLKVKDLLSVDVVIRNPNDGSPIVQYGKLCVDYHPDTVGSSGQKSIDWLGNEDDHEFQLYDFDQPGLTSAIQTDVSANGERKKLVPDDYEFVFRKNGAGGEIAYGKIELSVGALELSGDSAVGDQKSIAIDDGVAELYGMGDAGTTLPVPVLSSQPKSLLPADNEFVIRKKVGNSWQISYAPLSAKISATVEVDNDIVQTQRSIEWAEDDGQEYLQLYDMDVPGQQLPKTTIVMSSDGYTPLLPSTHEFVLRSGGAGGKIEYANLSCCIPDLSALSGTVISGDTEVIQSRKSIQTKEDQNGKKYHQLYNFDGCAGCWGDYSIDFCDNGCVSPIGCYATFVVRQPDGNGGYYIEYVPLALRQSHEKLDSQSGGLGRSLSWYTTDEGQGCQDYIELYNFFEAQAEDIEPEDVTVPYSDGILVRMDDSVRNELRYMTFNSLSNFTPVEKGDSNFQGNEDKSISTYWWDDNEYAIELYNWTVAGSAQTVAIHGDGCTYCWPQDTNITSTTNTADYILVKHMDSHGNMTLQYKQLQVTMPTLTGYDQDITNIYNEINDYSDQIVVLSGAIDALSGQVSGLTDCWESGGDSGTCYGSDIGDSNGTSVIDLDGKLLDGNWETAGDHYVTGSLDVTNDASIHGCAEIDGMLTLNGGMLFASGDLNVNAGVNAGCATFGQVYINGGGANGFIQIGNTTLNEAQLQQLLALI